EDEVLVNTYQELAMFNYTSISEFAPILAQSWTNNPAYTSYTFTLRNNAYFANGDTFNASVVWFNFYRTIVMNQIGAAYFTNLLYNGTTAYATGYALPAGVAAALEAAGYQLSSTNSTLRQIQAAKDLTHVLSNFNAADPTIQKMMSFPDQAVVVVDPYTVTFNLVNPYVYFVQVVCVPGAGQVDPAFVDQNGGVQPNSPNTYVNTHTMGTAPYVVKSYTPGDVLTEIANPNYWAAKLPASETNIMLLPPKIPTIVVEYATAATEMIQSIESNTASLIEGPPLPALTPNYLPSLATYPGIEVQNLANAPIFLCLMAVLDTMQYPYNITDFRVALSTAVNYTEIISSVGNGYTTPFVGPITPRLPYYNPADLAPYAYNPANSITMLKQLGFALSLPNGTTINPGGKTVQLSITYVTEDAAETKIAEEMQTMFADVGLQFKLNGVTTQAEEALISQSGTAASYPGMLIWYWYPSWLDPVYQDLVVQTNVQYGGIAGNVAWFNNTEVNDLTNTLPFNTNPTQVNQSVTQVYNIVYQQVPDLWLYGINPYWVQRTYLSGIIYNPGILGFYYPLMYYSSS
ncbi:MAG TPA: ABC transporter substrate-binding protein, partial [Candidatus Dormibacteraeota bacterium]|nr:ABC transporter substrate-binding protein [Candidatus Dormibacteraeota bacterium]